MFQSCDREGADAPACRTDVDTNVDAADMNVRATGGVSAPQGAADQNDL